MNWATPQHMSQDKKAKIFRLSSTCDRADTGDRSQLVEKNATQKEKISEMVAVVKR